MTTPSIPGYTHGTAAVPRSPLSLAELEQLKATVLFGEDDVRALRRSREILADQTDAILDVWYGFVGANPHLLASFADRAGAPDAAYLGAVRRRFGQWILDTASAVYDQAWLDYQHEIGRRHHRGAKNRTAGARAADLVPFRYLALLTVPVVTTLRPFLAARGHTADEVDAMQQAWLKSVLLQVTLWSHPYVVEGDF
jgi:hypothetical protein